MIKNKVYKVIAYNKKVKLKLKHNCLHEKDLKMFISSIHAHAQIEYNKIKPHIIYLLYTIYLIKFLF